MGMGLDSLQGCRDKIKLKWWYKLAFMAGDRYQLGRFGILNHVEVARGVG